MTLIDVDHFEIPSDAVARTAEALREAGHHGYELFVLWSGIETDCGFQIRTVHIPEQTSYQTSDGLLVRVEGEALHRLNATLFETGEMLAIQVHAHPTNAFHSSTDSAYPIVTMLGGLSIVVPDFAIRGVFTPGTAAYRLTQHGWKAVRRRQLAALLTVQDRQH